MHCRVPLILVTAFILVESSTTLSQTDVYLKAFTRTFQRMEIDLYPMEGESLNQDQTSMSELITQVVSNDLWMSGYFKVNIKAGVPPINNNSTNHAAGNSSNVLAWIAGNFQIRNNQITVQPRVVDRASGTTIIRKEYRDLSENKRSLLHRISDDIVYRLTGDRGIAGSQIAFVNEKEDGTKEIGVMDYDGFNIRELTSDRSLNLSPAWSPDGSNICYTSYKDGNPNLHAINLRSKNPSVLSEFQGLNSAPAWSPDGKRIALTLSKDGNAEIYLLQIKKKKFRRLTFSRAIDSSPTWSPSNREIAFTSDRPGSPQIYIMDSDGLNLRRLTFEGSYNDSPVWSPRGDKIGFVSRTESGFDIYTIDVDGRNLIRLTDSSGSNEDPYWSPNGFALIFSSTRSGRKELYSIFWDGSDQKRLTSGGIYYAPAWSPRLN